MRTIDLDTRLLAPESRLEQWRQSVNETFGSMHVEGLAGALPEGLLCSRKRGALAFHVMQYRGMSLWRKPLDVARLPEEFFTLTLPQSSLDVIHLGRARVLEPGRAYLFNHAVTYRTHALQEYRTRSVAFPAGLLRQRVGSLLPFYDLSESSSPAGIGLVRAFAENLTHGVVAWSDHEYATLVDQLLDLIGLFLLSPSALGGGSAESSTRAGHRERARQYLRINAGDCQLTPARVAAACGISLSYLHDVFRRAGLQVEEMIFEERLELARRLLLDPRRRGLPIRTLSYEAGFSDPGHFTRKFKSRFGVTPSELRGAGTSCS